MPWSGQNAVTCSPFFHMEEAAKGPDPVRIATDGKEHRAAKGAFRWWQHNNTNKSKN